VNGLATSQSVGWPGDGHPAPRPPERPVPLITCPSCKGRTPASAARCVQCGALPPPCAGCRGAGTCRACGDPATPVLAGPYGTRVCDQCGGTNVCPVCDGRKRRWPGAA